jgi:hypothetical protein
MIYWMNYMINISIEVIFHPFARFQSFGPMSLFDLPNRCAR